MQLEAGWAWDEVMERQLSMIKRALRRDAGPDRRALEVKPEEVDRRSRKREQTGRRETIFPKNVLRVRSSVDASKW